MKHIELPTYNKLKNYYYYDVIQTLAQYAYLKIESDRKMKENLMNNNGDFESLTANILDNVKQELDFQDEIFKAKEAQAVREALDKEKKVYKGLQKDELDSQHLWAGSKIKSMYKNTKMNFGGGKMSKMKAEGGED